MLFSRHSTFAGGIDLPDEKYATIDKPIAPPRRFERLVVPLAPCGGAPARLIVEPGTRVEAGEKIADADGSDSVPVFAPLAGRITSITTAAVAGADGFAPCAAVELTETAEPAGIEPLEPVFDWPSASAATLRAMIAEGGLTIHRRPEAPLAGWIETALAKDCRMLIANVMENQPYVTADHRLLLEHGGDVIRGLAILGRVINVGKLVLVADRRRIDDYALPPAAVKAHGVSRVALSHKYPTGADAMLVKVLTRREVPPGGTVMDTGAAVIDAASCFAVYRWVACGAAPTGRVVTVAGKRAGEPGNYYVPFGAECSALAAADGPLIHGGPMTGLHCAGGEVVAPATDAILAVEAAYAPAPSPCIRCGWCSDHCPARLNVAALNDAFELGLIDRAMRIGAPGCVGCGICSYVCPAALPLTRRVKQLKRTIEQYRQKAPLYAVR